MNSILSCVFKKLEKVCIIDSLCLIILITIWIEKQSKTRGCFGSEVVEDPKNLESRPKEVLKISNLVRRKNYIYKTEEVNAATVIANRWKDKKKDKKEAKNKLIAVT